MRHDFSSFLRLLAVTAFFAIALAACGGGGGSGPAGGGNPPPDDTVEVSGKVTFDRLPFKDMLGDGLDPDPAVRIESPAREVTVEAVNPTDRETVLASTVTDAAGDYSLSVPASTSMFIRARAEMIKAGAAPTWDFRVHNNTSDRLYAMEGEDFNSGTADVTRNLHAPSGWGTTSYTGTRVAAPFAILDTIYQAKQLILSSASRDFPALELFWSPDNRPTQGAFCPLDGDIGTSFYVGDGTIIGEEASGSCSRDDALAAGIYILGNFEQGDTDEFDQHVIAHEFGHYIEDRFSRSDSIGGEHESGQRLDLRVAFGEGWGNAYAAMTLADPIYRDSQQGVSTDFGFDLDGDAQPEGWFSEFSVGEVLWDVFDNGGSADDDGVDLGFTPIFDVMTGGQVSTDALTSIFSFAAALRDDNQAVAADIDSLLATKTISASDEFGDLETNDGTSATALPIYTDIVLNQSPVPICSSATFGDGNKLGYSRFLRLQLLSDAMITITADGAVGGSGTAEATDPDIFVHRRGELVAVGQEVGSSETISQEPLTAGTYIIEVLDFDLTGTTEPPHCMTVSVTGN